MFCVCVDVGVREVRKRDGGRVIWTRAHGMRARRKERERKVGPHSTLYVDDGIFRRKHSILNPSGNFSVFIFRLKAMLNCVYGIMTITISVLELIRLRLVQLNF